MSEKKVEENEAVEIEECKDLGEFIHSVIKEIYKRFKDPQNVTIQFNEETGELAVHGDGKELPITGTDIDRED